MDEMPESIENAISDLDQRAIADRMNRLDRYLDVGIDNLTQDERDDFYHLQGQLEGMRYTIGTLYDATHDSWG
jgi:hypothetical protein